MKETTLRKWMGGWELFIGLGAIAGASMMFADPTGRMFGMEPMLPAFRVLPLHEVLFRDLLFPGIALLLCNGLTNIVAFVLLRRRSRFAGRAGMICGIILMLWIGIQFCIFPLNVISTAYFLFGCTEALTGSLLARREAGPTA